MLYETLYQKRLRKFSHYRPIIPYERAELLCVCFTNTSPKAYAKFSGIRADTQKVVAIAPTSHFRRYKKSLLSLLLPPFKAVEGWW